jgi:hypothetical protein
MSDNTATVLIIAILVSPLLLVIWKGLNNE